MFLVIIEALFASEARWIAERNGFHDLSYKEEIIICGASDISDIYDIWLSYFAYHTLAVLNSNLLLNHLDVTYQLAISCEEFLTPVCFSVY